MEITTGTLLKERKEKMLIAFCNAADTTRRMVAWDKLNDEE
jgi:hypothetical protein